LGSFEPAGGAWVVVPEEEGPGPPVLDGRPEVSFE